MKDLVEYLAKSVVEHPEAVRVEEARGREGPVYVVAVAPEDKGRLIGKGGRVIEAIRTLVRAYARRKVGVEVR
ncbi:KH domain-containing protein [Thermus islandicus]|uniref:KH domain-containing protein n=1 Tax=Thermus islandicus TaxID=540988 RepID=UPI0003B4DE4D|nr:KH domain-containing protein [Thermus islandicus]